MPWSDLANMKRANVSVAESDRAQPPTVCPFDGEILDVHPDGVRRNCPAGNYTWPIGASLPVQRIT